MGSSGGWGKPNWSAKELLAEKWEKYKAGGDEGGGILPEGDGEAEEALGSDVDPTGVEGDSKEVVKQHGSPWYDAAEQADGPTDALAAAEEVVEAALLEKGERRAVCGKEGVEGDGEGVDDGVKALSGLVETDHALEDGLVVLELFVGELREELAEEGTVVQADGHAPAGQRVAHVQGVAETDKAGHIVETGGEVLVWHGLVDAGAVDGALVGVLEARFDGLGQMWEHTGCKVLEHVGLLWELGRAVRTEDSAVVGADLVDEDGGVLAQDHVAVVLLGQVCVDEVHADKVRPDRGDKVSCELLAELRVDPVAAEHQGRPEDTLVCDLDADDPPVFLHHSRHVAVKLRDVLLGKTQLPQAGQELTVVESHPSQVRALVPLPHVERRVGLHLVLVALLHGARHGCRSQCPQHRLLRVRDRHPVAEVRDVVALHGDRLDIVHGLCHA